jgi:mannose-6-phosphate isomerase-like protein (cupin superfamily)
VDEERIEAAVVRAWHDAVNGGEIDRLAELLDDDVEFGGPRGAGRGATVVLDWARNSGIHLEPIRWFQRGEDIVVEELATWHLPESGEMAPPGDVSTHFKVRNDVIRRVVRYDSLPAALAAAGLDESKHLRPAPRPTTVGEPPPVVPSLSVITRNQLPYAGNSYELEGYLHGATPVSIIFFDGPPGSGPTLHRHPYAEVFIVEEGQATFTVGEATFEVSAGQIAIAPAGVAHKFVNSGNGPLRQIDIHTNDRFVTEWLGE